MSRQPQRPRPPTLADVARLAGVSLPTASRVLNAGVRGPGSGSEENREKVLAAARQLGYTVSAAAQTVKNGRSRTVALFVGDIDDFGSATMISGVMHAAENRGLSVAVRATHDEAERERELLHSMRTDRLLGVIFATSRSTDVAREHAMETELRILHDLGTKIVVVGSSQLRYPSVVVDNASAARALARGLVAVGHRRFGIAAGPSNQVTSHDRVSGFLAGLAEERVRVEMDDLVHCDFSRDGGFEAGKALARRLAHLDHVAAMSDAMAVGLIAGFREVGAAVPEDLEVSGFDHVPMLGDVMPTFSTVEVPLGQFGEAALTLIEDESTAATTVISLPSCPIVRGRRLDLVDR